MIQRIQTVYILVSFLLITFLFFLPFAEIAYQGSLYVFNIKGILLSGELKENGLAIFVLIVILLAVHGFAIFSFKKRILQMRVMVFAILLLLGLFGMFFFFAGYSFEEAVVSYQFTVVFPLVAAILDYLAIRAIGKDEALIRSIDRIR